MTLENAQVIDGGGRTLIPGLMDAHVHLAAVQRFKVIRSDLDWMCVGALVNEGAPAKSECHRCDENRNEN